MNDLLQIAEEAIVSLQARVAHLEKQRDELQAANSREVTLRRRAEWVAQALTREPPPGIYDPVEILSFADEKAVALFPLDAETIPPPCPENITVKGCEG